MPELLENEVISLSDSHLVKVNLIDGSTVNVEIKEWADYIDKNRDKIKFRQSTRRREPLGFPES
jgi:hypothetical protein